VISRIVGARDVERNLGRLAKLADESVAVPALEAGGEIIAEEMRDLVSVRSGLTRDSIGVEVSRYSFGGANRGFSVRVGPRKPDGFKAHWLEFGNVHMAAEPFILPAFDSKSGAARRAVADHLRGEIRRF
jgi:HK97 gp10 family phage protein